MNKIYKVIWSRVRHCYVVVSELAKRAGKEKSSHPGLAAHLAAGALCVCLLTLGGHGTPAEAAGQPAVSDLVPGRALRDLHCPQEPRVLCRRDPAGVSAERPLSRGADRPPDPAAENRFCFTGGLWVLALRYGRKRDPSDRLRARGRRIRSCPTYGNGAHF